MQSKNADDIGVEGDGNCNCDSCRNRKSFSVPKSLLESFIRKDVVIFAGAGISTENNNVLPFTFYKEIAEEVGIDPQNGPGFPELMSEICSRPNGRQVMLIKLKSRFDYIKSFGELYRDATAFHRELSTIHQVENIITTNWDDYFELHCAATPYVSAEDFALWKVPGRKVFKIHGSINSLGSIVADVKDYEACYERLSNGLIGSHLKSLLATKTVVYIGYSFSDSDFIKIHSLLTEEMKGMRPHSYIITLDENSKTRFQEMGMTPIVTSGDFFLSSIKEHLAQIGHMVPDEAFVGLEDMYLQVTDVHDKTCRISMSKHPTVALTACYQDGLMHALERLLTRQITGDYSDPNSVVEKIYHYGVIRKSRVSSKKFTDVAYIDGYTNGLMLLLASDKERASVPMFYAYGMKAHPSNMKDYKAYLKVAESQHRAAFKWCKNLMENEVRIVPGMVFHHTPTLL